MTRTGICLLCRVGSTRLPGKILRVLAGRTLLEHIVSRIRIGAPECPIVVTTSVEASDDPLAELAGRLKIPCYRGPLEDVAGRMLACARHYGWDYVVRINGDNLFVDPPTLRAMLDTAAAGTFDLVTNVPGRTFPYGMSVEILRTSAFAEALKKADAPRYREHVTLWFYDHPDSCRMQAVKNTAAPDGAGLQLAIDTPDDFERAGYVLAHLGDRPEEGRMQDVVRLAREWNAMQQRNGKKHEP